jgi:hypothetical protein
MRAGDGEGRGLDGQQSVVFEQPLRRERRAIPLRRLRGAYWGAM